MYNLQRMKIMKRVLYSALALLGIFAVSCKKEIEAPVAPAEDTATYHKQTITATIGDDTRTAYADFKKFSWKAGDKVDIFTHNESEEMTRIATFTAQEDGTTTVFEGDVEDGYNLVDLAVYPDRAGFVADGLAIYTPALVYIDGTDDTYYTASSENPLENLALVGRLNENADAYAFKTAMGAVKITLTDLSSDARFLRISAPEKISGYFFIDDNDCISNESAVPGTYTYQDAQGNQRTANYSNNNIWYHFTPAADGTATIYVPLPVGKLSAGTTIYVENEDEDVLFQKTTKKDIVVERNKVTELTALAAKNEWVSLGLGLFGDHYHFNADYDQEVEIQQNAAEPTQFRLVDPYAGYRELLEYEPTGSEYGPDQYLNFRILQKGEMVYGTTVAYDDLVIFDEYYTGIIDDGDEVDPCLVHPSNWTSFTQEQWKRSIVVKYQADGVTPANIQLAPVIFWMTDPEEGSGTWTGGNLLGRNNVIEIRFPGAERVDLSASLSFVEIVDDDPAQAVAQIAFECSKAITGAKIVIAANETDAAAALADASRYVQVSEGGEYEVKMPANAPSGDYFIYAQTTVADGLTPACAQLLASNSFKYFNANTDLGYTLDDVIGSYSADDYYYLSTWTAATMTMVIEESDDPLSSDIMITSLCPEILARYGDTCTGKLYGSFNTATGEIVITAGQVIAHNADADIDWTVADYPQTQDLHLVLTSPGHILNEGNYCFYAGSYGLQCYSNAGVEFIRDSNSGKSAPARSFGATRGKASISEGLKGLSPFIPITPAFRAK